MFFLWLARTQISEAPPASCWVSRDWWHNWNLSTDALTQDTSNADSILTAASNTPSQNAFSSVIFLNIFAYTYELFYSLFSVACYILYTLICQTFFFFLTISRSLFILLKIGSSHFKIIYLFYWRGRKRNTYTITHTHTYTEHSHTHTHTALVCWSTPHIPGVTEPGLKPGGVNKELKPGPVPGRQ